jgi:hypothetical protein
MSKITTAPTLDELFAYAGSKRTLEKTTEEQGRVSLEKGFPPETALPPSQGGQPPSRADFNAILYLLSQFAYFEQSGGAFDWSEDRDYIAGCEIRRKGVRYRCVTANGINYGGAKDPATAGNSYNWGDIAGDKCWLNLDSIYTSARATLVNALNDGNLKIWAGSQAQYNALTAKDANTIYITKKS